ncbi:TonB-system energizer ExbB [Nitratifractor sp.]|uniref:TonB-system energizer ExbB n=1 Tax=Nitratifractor sp. TaxID=2268144 RepID=UPI0025E0F81B|nr:TonB-system energizer ExbB [Nitratifractor sp.]
MPVETLKNIVDYGIIGILLLMSVATFAYAIERFLFFRRIDLAQYPNRKMLELDLGRHLGPLATIGSSAPYIGLLGTVIAIILTFYVIGEQKTAIDTGEIMKNLALALKATAAGLIVAIPASIFYNVLMDRVDRLLTRWEILNQSDGDR